MVVRDKKEPVKDEQTSLRQNLLRKPSPPTSSLKMSGSATPTPPLTQGAGYGVIIGLGAFFAIVSDTVQAWKFTKDRLILITMQIRLSLAYRSHCDDSVASHRLLQSMQLHRARLVSGSRLAVRSARGVGRYH